MHFKDYPDFKPNLTPKQVMKMGSFGGTYWRPIYSSVTKKHYKNKHLKYGWNLPDEILTCPNYDKTKNKYGVKVGMTLEYWEESGWISKYDPYGWFQWYCNFYIGRRCPDDLRQIKRWKSFVSRMLGLIKPGKENKKVKQSLQHWAYKI